MRRQIRLATTLSIAAAAMLAADADTAGAQTVPAAAARTDLPTDVLEAAATGRARGSEEAPVVVYEIADFQCPYCARFAAEVYPTIDEEYVRTGRVQWVYVNLPLPAHREAFPAAEAALCAGAVSDRFWEVHDRLYAEQPAWSGSPDAASLFTTYARDTGVDMGEWQRCVDEDRVAPLIVQDLLGASAAQISGTPTFIVNRQSKIVGLKTIEEWREILDRAGREQ